MTRALRWHWSMMRNEPVLPRSVLGRDAADGQDSDWDFSFGKLVRLQKHVFELHAKRIDRTIEFSGNVASEQIKDVIEEIFRDYDPEAELSNLITVTAPFRSAAEDDDYIEFKAKVPVGMGAGSVAVERYPLFTPEQLPAVGERFRFHVDLSATASDLAPVRFDVPSDWSIVTVDVDVISGQLRFADGANRRKIFLERDGSSIAATFDAEVVGVTDVGNVDIRVFFNCLGRYSGMSSSSFKAIERVPAPAPSPVLVPSGNAVALLLDAPAAKMTIKVLKVDDNGSYMWILDAPRGLQLGTGVRSEMVAVPDSREFATGLLGQCPKLAPGRHASAMRGIGERIWARSPATFRLLYKDMRAKFGPAFTIQIVTDEPYVPWEMMHPDSDSDIADPDHLFMTHPVCRWLASQEGRFRNSFEKGSIASFVPESKPALPEAVAEGAWLVQNLGAKAMPANYEFFTKFWSTDLPAETVGVLHFAGHGEANPDARIQLTDGYVSCDDVHGGVRLGSRDGTFVVLNACEAANAGFKLGLASGWAASLTARDFGGVLAPLWSVEDGHSSEFVKQYLSEFRRGVPMGLALLRTRNAQRDVSSAAFAYACHGDVNATMR